MSIFKLQITEYNSKYILDGQLLSPHVYFVTINLRRSIARFETKVGWCPQVREPGPFLPKTRALSIKKAIPGASRHFLKFFHLIAGDKGLLNISG